jgi:uncharacterized membrane protein YphA (DoxX/SURF4 family)
MLVVSHLYSSKNNFMKKTLFTDIVAALYILLFVYAAISKIIDYQKFRIQLGQSPLLTYYAGFISVTIPASEIIISILLAIDKYRLFGLYASFSLMSMFSAYIIAITQFSDYIPCSCGGILQKMSWNQHLVFNFLLVSLAAAGILLYRFPEKKLTAYKISSQGT